MKNLYKLRQNKKVLFSYFILFIMFSGTVVFSQDSAVIPANNNQSVSWINGTTFTSPVTASDLGGGSPWNNLGNITNTNTSDYASSSSSGAGDHATSVISISNGEIYRTKPFTGYWIGLIASRQLSGFLTAINPLGRNEITISTYRNGAPTGDEVTFGWNAIGDTDQGFYAHQEFDEVRIKLVSALAIGTNPSIEQRLKQVYFKRYTRFGGGFDTVGDKEATCNAQIPLTGLGLTGSGAASVVIPVPPFIVYVPATIWFDFAAKMEDERSDTHGEIPFISVGQATYSGRLTDNAVVFPAGTFGGAVYKVDAIHAGLNLKKIIRFYITRADGSVEMVYSEEENEYLSTSASGEFLTVGAVSPEDFDAIEYEIQANLTAVGGVLVAHYPIVQRFCDAVITCNEQTSLIAGIQGGQENHPVHAHAIGTTVLNVSVGNPGIDNVHRVIDGDLNNYATIGAAVGASLYSNYGIAVVSEQNGGYPAGTFAGFEIEEDNWAAASFSKRYIVSTFLNGNLVETYSNQNVLGVDFFTPNKGKHIIGFKTNETTGNFDEVRITVEQIGSASALASTKVYRAVIETYCPTDFEILTECNELTNLKRPDFPVYIDGRNTGIQGFATANTYFEDLNNIIADTNVPAKLHTTVGAVTTASVGVQDGSKTGADLYPKGTFAGFDVAFPTIVSGELFGSTITITTIDEEGEAVESQVMNSSFFGAHSSILSGTDARQVIGFMAKEPFSGVKLTINKNASVDWGTIEIYSAVIERFCAKDITCEEMERIGNPEHPVFINGSRTGIFAFADGNSSISNSQNAIDDDESTYAEIQLGLTVGSEMGFSVANGAYVDDGSTLEKYYYPANTYIGFDLGTQTWFEANGFYEMKIELLKDGVLLPEGDNSGTQYGAGVSTDILTGGWKRMNVGTVAYSEFDEVRLRIERLGGATLGEIRIHDVVARNYNTGDCGVYELGCDGEYVLVDNATDPKAIPAVVEFARTGYEGVASAGFGIEDVWNAVTAQNNDYAQIHFPSNAVGSASISVAAPGVVFPVGTYAGYTIDKDQWPISGGIFTGIKITTYLNGEEQESVSDTSLADFTFIVQWFGTEDDVYTPGFISTKPFNEIQITVQSIAQLLDHPFSIYGAYVVPKNVNQNPGDGTTPVICDICTKPGVGGTALTSSVGITTKGAESSVNNWPQSVPNGYLVLDAAQKGMVITHMTADQINALTPVEGMLVFDTDAGCVKMYRGNNPGVDNTRTGWVCIKRGCNVNL